VEGSAELPLLLDCFSSQRWACGVGGCACLPACECVCVRVPACVRMCVYLPEFRSRLAFVAVKGIKVFTVDMFF
jgi:hypothetical protein